MDGWGLAWPPAWAVHQEVLLREGAGSGEARRILFPPSRRQLQSSLGKGASEARVLLGLGLGLGRLGRHRPRKA